MSNHCYSFNLFTLGELVIIHSPDREQRDKYTIKVRAVKTPKVSEREVPVFFYTLYVQEKEREIIGMYICHSVYVNGIIRVIVGRILL